jgi:hypothetical protein
MDGNILATIGSAIGVLVGVYAIVNRTEDRLGKRIDETDKNLGKRIEESKETLRAEIKVAVTGLELKIVERFSGSEKSMAEMEKRLNERIDTRLVHK